MLINKNNFLIRLYRWTYAVSEKKLEQQNNLCPIFWRMLISLIFLVPNLVFGLPAHIITYVTKEAYYDTKMWIKYIISLLVYIILFFLLELVLSIIVYFRNVELLGMRVKDAKVILIWVIATIIMFTIAILAYRLSTQMIKRKNHNGTNKSKSILIEGVKAWYNKYCPKITWID